MGSLIGSSSLDLNLEENWLQTFTGNVFHLFKPTVEEVHLRDIAHALGMNCRYLGHTQTFYSVAEHSILVAQYLQRVDPLTAMCGLAHDMGEAYFGDWPTPLKQAIPQLKVIESKIMGVIKQRFALPEVFPSIVKEVDARILLNEMKQYMPNPPQDWGLPDLEPLEDIKFFGFGPQEAEEAFIRMYFSLKNQL